MRQALLFAALVVLACSSARDSVRAGSAPGNEPMTSATPALATQEPTSAQPPSRAEDVVELLHGTRVADPYRWLEEEKAPEVQQWMAAQDAYTRARLAAVPGREALVQRLKALAYVDAVGVPVKAAGRFFYLRTFSDKEKGVLYWREGEKGEERVLLDPNAWSQDGTVSLGVWVPSHDGKKVVFTRKPNAADEAVLHVIDVDSGKESSVDVIPGAKYASPRWTPDSRAFVYEWLPTDPSIPVAERPGYTEVRLHRLGSAPAEDKVLHARTNDPTVFLRSDLSRDGRYLFVYIQRGWAETDVYWQRFGQEQGFRKLARGIWPEAQEARRAVYEVTAWKDRFYVLTNEGAPKKRIFVVDPAQLGKAPESEAALQKSRRSWRELVPEDAEATLEGMGVVGGRLALSYLKSAASELRVVGLDGKGTRVLSLPTLGTATQVVGEEDQADGYFAFSSFTVPRQVYRANVQSGQVELWAEVKVPVRGEDFEVRQVFYPSKDGTRVPMFLVHRKGLQLDGSHPTLLYGYGGFDISLTPSFKATLFPWLEAGGIYAVANLRGGGEFGKAWHDAGRLGSKQNVFDDFIAAGEFLVREGYTQPARLAIHGGSNGGLLVGAAMVQRPELFGAVVCAVPLLDMVRYHLFGSGRTWIPEYGTAEREADFRWIYAYSPYHHVKEGTAYPALLMMAADHDDRVDPLHARKFMAAVQNATSSQAPVLLRVERNAGHGGADLVRQLVEASADQYLFLMQQFGMAPQATPRTPQASGQPG